MDAVSPASSSSSPRTVVFGGSMMWNDAVHLMAQEVLRAFRVRRGPCKFIPYPPTAIYPGQIGLPNPVCLTQLLCSVYNPRIDFT